MDPKFIEERIGGVWFIFGEHSGTGRVDVANSSGDVFQNLPREVAERAILANDEFRRKLYAILADVKP